MAAVRIRTGKVLTKTRRYFLASRGLGGYAPCIAACLRFLLGESLHPGHGKSLEFRAYMFNRSLEPFLNVLSRYLVIINDRLVCTFGGSARKKKQCGRAAALAEVNKLLSIWFRDT